MMKAILLVFVLSSCAIEDEPTIDLTLEDGKADGLRGRRLALSFPGDMVYLGNPQLEHADAVLTRYLAEDKIMVQTTRFLLRQESEIDGVPIDLQAFLQSVQFRSAEPGVEVGFVMFDEAEKPLTCRTPRGPVNFFKRVVADFRRDELTLNDTTTVPLADCGIPNREPDTVMLLPVPIRWADGTVGDAEYVLDYQWL